MITLDNISLERLNIKTYEPKLYKLICQFGSQSVEDAVKIAKILYDESDLKRVCLRAKEISKRVDDLNKKKKKLDVYKTKRYYFADCTDRKNNGNLLLLKNPTKKFSSRYSSLSDKSISKIKSDLGLMTEYGDNYALFSYRSIGRNEIKNILKALKMYDEQVLKQSNLTDDQSNIFIFNHDEKADIVSDNYENIINYFVDNNKDLLWGKMTDNQKRLYLSSVTKKTIDDRLTRKNIINYVANYTTLDELENIEKDDYKVLTKFMK